MKQIIKIFTPGPDEIPVGGDRNTPDNDERVDRSDRNDRDEEIINPTKQDIDHDKSIGDKIKDALQDWSNDNERDIQEDDSTPLRSGL